MKRENVARRDLRRRLFRGHQRAGKGYRATDADVAAVEKADLGIGRRLVALLQAGRDIAGAARGPDLLRPDWGHTVDAVDRPALSGLLQFVADKREASRPVDDNFVEHRDRLARDLMISEALIGELRRHDLKLFTTDQGALIDLVAHNMDRMRKALRQSMPFWPSWISPCWC